MVSGSCSRRRRTLRPQCKTKKKKKRPHQNFLSVEKGWETEAVISSPHQAFVASDYYCGWHVRLSRSYSPCIAIRMHSAMDNEMNWVDFTAKNPWICIKCGGSRRGKDAENYIFAHFPLSLSLPSRSFYPSSPLFSLYPRKSSPGKRKGNKQVEFSNLLTYKIPGLVHGILMCICGINFFTVILNLSYYFPLIPTSSQFQQGTRWEGKLWLKNVKFNNNLIWKT